VLTSEIIAIIYDLDGTLVDSAPVVCNLLDEMRGERGLPPLTRTHYIKLLSLGGNELIKGALDLRTDGLVEQALNEFRARYVDIPASLDSLYPDVIKSLKRLQVKGYRLGLCTNKPRIQVDKLLKELGLESYFEIVSAGGDLPHKKPHPSTMQVCLKHFQYAPRRVLFVGDSTVDEALAKEVQMPFAFFENGYDDGVKRTLATFCFKNHSQLLNALCP
jgi:phosphoglycolate phosphatase